MPTLYSIPRFEHAHSRGELNKLTEKGRPWPWVRMPTRFDGEGYKMLMATPGGVEAFGVYVALAELAANMPTKGVLENGRGPLTPRRIQVKTSIPADIIERSLEILTDPEVGWVRAERVPDKAASEKSGDDGKEKGDSPALFPDDAPAPEPKPAPKADPVVEAFDRFWANVPTKIGKVAACRAFTKAVKEGTAPEEIMAGLPVYHAWEERRARDADYRPLHPATWLNNKRWEDEMPAARRLPGQSDISADADNVDPRDVMI